MVYLKSLHESMQETLSIMDGFTVGTLVISNNVPYLQLAIGELITLNDSFLIQVKNGDEYIPVTVNQILTTMSSDGWLLFTGLDCRVKLVQAA